jgi:hypothetical protein
MLPFGKMLSMIGLRPVKKIVIMVLFIPVACLVLGMTSIGDHAKVFGDR